MTDTTRIIAPGETFLPLAFDGPQTDLSNEAYTFCEDVREAEGPATFEDFDLGPEAILPAGTTFVISGLWGYDDAERMTDAKTYRYTVGRAATVREVVKVMLSVYHNDVTYGRFFFIENVTQREDGTVEIIWGT